MFELLEIKPAKIEPADPADIEPTKVEQIRIEQIEIEPDEVEHVVLKPAEFELLEIELVKDWIVSCEKEDPRDKMNSAFKPDCIAKGYPLVKWIRSVRQGLEICRSNSYSSGYSHECNIVRKLKFKEMMGSGGTGIPMTI